MTFLDAFAIVALLLDEPAAEDVSRTLRDDACSIPAVNLAEALDVLQRRHGVDRADIAVALDPLLAAGLDVFAQDGRAASRAADLRQRYYDRRSAAVSLADCLLLAAAEPGDRIATADPPVATIARLESIDVVALPDSTGARP